MLEVNQEFEKANLGDARLNRRLKEIVQAWSKRPDAGLPAAMGSEAGLKGAYRFLNHSDIQAKVLLELHEEKTKERIQQREQEVVVAHDTTSFSFGGESEREGMGRLLSKGQGFFAHVACCFGGEEKEPLGVLGSQFWIRAEERKKRKPTHTERMADKERESRRWRELASQVHKKAGESQGRLIHVMDREADSYALFDSLVREKIRYVVRLRQDRSLVEEEREGKNITKALEKIPVFVEREVPLSARKRHAVPSKRRIHPERRTRMARLQLKATQVQLKKPSYLPREMTPTLKLSVVEAIEGNPPEGEPAVHWRLYTQEPISTAAEVERVVDLYRMRWGIEEYFKALKTGCAYEKLQLESYDALLVALSLLLPIAWNLLRLRFLERTAPLTPATSFFSPLQILMLQSLVVGKFAQKPMAQITVKEAFAALAELGGHLRHNGPPGWLTLTRGWLRLHHAVTPVLSLLTGKRCVQS